MYADPNVRHTYPARKRQPRYRRRRRHIYIPNPLLLLIPAIILFLILDANSQKEVAAFEETSTSEKISIFFDGEAPVISGVRNLYTYAGDSIAYDEGITVTDNKDASPELKVNSSHVDIAVPGTYEITYTATDERGNKTSAAATVTVMEKQEGFVDTKTIYAAVDETLDKILMDGMRVAEQVEAIYSWARGYLMYADKTVHDDWHQAGYEMLTTLSGDCYGYFAVTKLMLERLGIPNIDVRKVKNSEEDSDHFWSLVSVDGGISYYHLDTTPRIGEGDKFLLVTDAYLDAYSEAHGNCHNRDKSLYPATPEE